MKKKKKKPVKKVRAKRVSARSLFSQACRKWKEIAYLNWGRACQVQERYPHIKTRHSKIYVPDHVITRRDTNLFFHPLNNVVVCSTCNFLKKFHKRGLDYTITQILIERIGQDAFNSLLYTHQTAMTLRGWRQMPALKTVLEQLENEYNRLKGLPQSESGIDTPD